MIGSAIVMFCINLFDGISLDQSDADFSGCESDDVYSERVHLNRKVGAKK